MEVIVDQPAGVVPPLLLAPVLFAGPTALSLSTAKRWIWVGGAALQVMAIAMYLVVAADRTPRVRGVGV